MSLKKKKNSKYSIQLNTMNYKIKVETENLEYQLKYSCFHYEIQTVVFISFHYIICKVEGNCDRKKIVSSKLDKNELHFRKHRPKTNWKNTYKHSLG